ncbi:Hippocampus abundant transcript 1 protein [Datura stramonium]|uniref:Hippocampus abundant transcript 1 protein n=1 Tax=Datura stramonium TaxID=4076 RepID=A0ABS8T515_DATST|nr:Hippocampus abundant transcript 1 protein [Datura stramonium]
MDKISSLKHLFVTVFLSNFALNVVTPAITDITMDALCPSQDKCTLAIIFLVSKSRLFAHNSRHSLDFSFSNNGIPEDNKLFPITLCIRSTIGMLSDTGIQCLPLLMRALLHIYAFTFAVHFLSTAQIFLVSSISSTTAAIYMTIFLKDTTASTLIRTMTMLSINLYYQMTLMILEVIPRKDAESKNIPSFFILFTCSKSSTTLLLATFISFLYGLTGGIQTPFMGSNISQLILVPRLAPMIGEQTILSLALMAGFINMLIDSIAWADWVPYVVALFPMFLFLAKPARELHLIILVLVCLHRPWLIAIIPSMMIRFGTYNSNYKIGDVIC